MVENDKADVCSPVGDGKPCCSVESVVSVDERGQMVLPKDLREKAKIKAGEKLAAVLCTKSNNESYICLIKVENLGDMVLGFMEPMAGNTSGKD